MKSSEEVTSKEETKTKTSSLSKPKPLALKPYEFDPKNLTSIVKQYGAIDPKTDIKAAKKARTALRKKIKEIKDVHTYNKRQALQFKKDVEAYDKQKFTELTVDLVRLFDKLDSGIKSIENGAEIRKQEIQNNITSLNNDINTGILDATNIEAIQEVQIKINNINPKDKALYEGREGEVDTMKTQLLLRAANREREIQNAGGSLKIDGVKPIKMAPEGSDLPMDESERVSDTELINFLQSNAAAKGWAVNISPNTGVQVFQVDDPKAPRDLRVAIREAMSNHKSL